MGWRVERRPWYATHMADATPGPSPSREVNPTPADGDLTLADEKKMLGARRLEHLKMLQAVAVRLASNSFQLKGWAIGLVSGLGAVAGWKDQIVFPLWGAYVVSLVFSYLDTWFLQRERAYRKLFDAVKVLPATSSERMFDMDSQRYIREVGWWKTFWSPTVAPLYLLLAWGTGIVAWWWTRGACASDPAEWCFAPESRAWIASVAGVVALPLVLHGALALRARE